MKAMRMERVEYEIGNSWEAVAEFFGIPEEEMQVTYVDGQITLVMYNYKLIGKINGAPDVD